MVMAALVTLMVSITLFADAYSFMSTTRTTRTAAAVTTRRSTMYMKRGRGSFKKEIGGDGDSTNSGGVGSSGSSFASAGARNWLQVPDKTTKDLPVEEGKVLLLETNAFLLKNAQTNPNGAVSVLKYEGETYCFDANCPNCKIPMTKAKALPPNEETEQTNNAPRVACDFCQSTYNLKSGEKLESQQGGGLFGGIAKAVLGANKDAGTLQIYQLGEKNDKIMFSMD